MVAYFQAVSDQLDCVGNQVHVVLGTSTFRVAREALLAGESLQKGHEIVGEDFDSLSRVGVTSTDSRLHEEVLLNDVLALL